MDRTTFGRKTLNAQRPRADRFVTPREAYPEIRRRILWSTRGEHRVGDIWCTKSLQQKKYMSYLDEALGLEPLNQDPDEDKSPQVWPCVPRRKSYLSTADSILDLPSYGYADCCLDEALGLEPLNQDPDEDKSPQVWSCVPRRKSYLWTADSILDLPSYGYADFPDLLDWSSNNVLVAALGSSYHKWSWRTQSLISHGETDTDIQCCKFDPTGELLLLGTAYRAAELHDNARSKRIARYVCSSGQLRLRHNQICSITSIDWSPTGNGYVLGCSLGWLTRMSRNSHEFLAEEVIPGAVLVVRVSPDARYVAAAGVNSRSVLVLTWPDLELCSTMKTDWTIKTLTWHPWRSALLCIGAASSARHARFTFWDVPSGNISDFTLGDTPYIVDSMLFSHRTGELVISLWKSERSTFPMSYSQLLVLSGPNTVVDQWGEGRVGVDRIKTMIFSPDGTKLATATADEDLIIWNFLPEEKVKKKRKKHYLMPVFFDSVTYGGTSLR